LDIKVVTFRNAPNLMDNLSAHTRAVSKINLPNAPGAYAPQLRETRSWSWAAASVEAEGSCGCLFKRKD
jgi:hypothetical protein